MLAPAVVTAQDIVIAVHGSTGINPYTAFSYVDRYGSDLRFRSNVLQYPLLSGSPRAAVMVENTAFVSESRCSGYPNSVCSPRVIRYGSDGQAREVGPSFAETPQVLRLTSRSELVAVSSKEIVRIQATGETLEERTYSLPSGGQVLLDADVDASGCVIAISYDPRQLALGNLCSSTFVLSQPLPGIVVHGVRFLPDGTLLTTSPTGVRRIDSTGQVLRLYPEPRGDCFLAIWPGSHEALVACQNIVSRLDLDSGAVTSQAQVQNGLNIESIDIVQSAPMRRRATEH